MLTSNSVYYAASLMQREAGDSSTLYAGHLGHVLVFIADTKEWLGWEPSASEFPADKGVQWEALPYGGNVFTACHQSAEGVQTWYAFATDRQRRMFHEMNSVDKVGPATVMRIFLKNSFRTICELIDSGDRAAFVKLPGIGPKTGDKLVKVLFSDAPPQPEGAPRIVLDENAVAAMRTLGYDAKPARAAVEQAMGNKPGADTPEIVSEALRLMAKS